MGCDIHMYAEVRRDGVWCAASEFEQPTEGAKKLSYNDFWNDRNYDTFAILGNVRNGSGFAGCKTGGGFVPLTDNRGLPEDLCEEFERAASSGLDEDDEDYDRGLWFGDHSFSHCTLAEILDYDWTRKTTKQGVVDLKEFERVERMKSWDAWPLEWCGGTSGRDIVTVSSLVGQQMLKEIKGAEQWISDEMIKAYEEKKGKRFYVVYEWETSYARACRDFWVEAVARLLRMGNPEDVRIVYGFDS